MFPVGIRITAIALGTILVLGACTPHRPPTNSPRDEPEVVAVERADIETVLVLDGVVVSHTPFIVTAPHSGQFEHLDTGSYALRADGEVLAIPALTDVPFSAERVIAPAGAVLRGLPLLEARHEGFAIVTDIDAAQILRIHDAPLGARAQVSGGAGPFDCQLLDPFPGSIDGLTYSYACAIPPAQRVLAGMTGRLAVTLSRRTGVLSLPIEAVAGSLDSGEVRVKTPDGFETRKVTLGPSDGVRIEITSGLRLGDEVTFPSFGLFTEGG